MLPPHKFELTSPLMAKTNLGDQAMKDLVKKEDPQSSDGGISTANSTKKKKGPSKSTSR